MPIAPVEELYVMGLVLEREALVMKAESLEKELIAVGKEAKERSPLKY